MTQTKAEKKPEKKRNVCTMDSVSLKQIPKFSGERKAVWLTKATAVCALNGVSPTLKARFKDMLPANDAILLDKTKPVSVHCEQECEPSSDESLDSDAL